MGKEMKIPPIKNGTVIDHITARQALNVLEILKIDKNTDGSVELVMNVKSKTMGRKDIVKVENRELKPEEVDKIALIAPNATINIVRDSEVITKHKVELPETIEGIIRCANPNCISNAEREPVISKFIVEKGNQPKVRCIFCGRYTEIEGDVSKAFSIKGG